MEVDERGFLFTDSSAQQLNMKWYARHHLAKTERAEKRIRIRTSRDPVMPCDTHIFTNDVITVAALKEHFGWTSRGKVGHEGPWREVNYARATDLCQLTREHGAVEVRFREAHTRILLHTMLVTDDWFMHSRRDSWPLRILDVTNEFHHTFARAHGLRFERRQWYASLIGIGNVEGTCAHIRMSICAPPRRVSVPAVLYCQSRHYCSTCCSVTCHCRSSFAIYTTGGVVNNTTGGVVKQHDWSVVQQLPSTLRLLKLPLALRSLVCAYLTCHEQRTSQLTCRVMRDTLAHSASAPASLVVGAGQTADWRTHRHRVQKMHATGRGNRFWKCLRRLEFDSAAMSSVLPPPPPLPPFPSLESVSGSDMKRTSPSIVVSPPFRVLDLDLESIYKGNIHLLRHLGTQLKKLQLRIIYASDLLVLPQTLNVFSIHIICDDRGYLNNDVCPTAKEKEAQQHMAAIVGVSLIRLVNLTEFAYRYHPLTCFVWKALECGAPQLHTLKVCLSENAFHIHDRPFARFVGLIRLTVRCGESLANHLILALPSTLERLAVIFVTSTVLYERRPANRDQKTDAFISDQKRDVSASDQTRDVPISDQEMGVTAKSPSLGRGLRVLFVVAHDTRGFLKSMCLYQGCGKIGDMLRVLKIRSRARELADTSFWTILQGFRHVRALRLSNFLRVGAPLWRSTIMRRFEIVARQSPSHVSRWSAYARAFPRLERVMLPLTDNPSNTICSEFNCLAHLRVSGALSEFGDAVLQRIAKIPNLKTLVLPDVYRFVEYDLNDVPQGLSKCIADCAFAVSYCPKLNPCDGY
jgi:hypothetical protein